jgi:hypothetical protein
VLNKKRQRRRNHFQDAFVFLLSHTNHAVSECQAVSKEKSFSTQTLQSSCPAFPLPYLRQKIKHVARLRDFSDCFATVFALRKKAEENSFCPFSLLIPSRHADLLPWH